MTNMWCHEKVARIMESPSLLVDGNCAEIDCKVHDHNATIDTTLIEFHIQFKVNTFF